MSIKDSISFLEELKDKANEDDKHGLMISIDYLKVAYEHFEAPKKEDEDYKCIVVLNNIAEFREFKAWREGRDNREENIGNKS